MHWILSLSVLLKRPVNNLSKKHRYTCKYAPNDKFGNSSYYIHLTLYMYMKRQINVHVLNHLDNYLITRAL